MTAFHARHRIARWLVLAAAVALPAQWVDAASRYDPALRFRTLTTPHFFIYFHQGEEAIAARVASLAEDVHRVLTARMQTAPAGRTHVILVDQDDFTNGWATPLPYNTIEITAAPPAPQSVVGKTEEWLHLVLVHEYTHILHLDRSRGFASVVRTVFGRSLVSFPNLFLPPWQIEGLATFEESATGSGRVNSGDFALFVSEPARQHGAFSLDRATSDFDSWPSGNTPYAYGAFFHRYLADRFGEEKFADLSRRTAGRFYFLSSPAFKQTFGKSLGGLWKDFEHAEAVRVADGSPDRGRRLTRQGFELAGPAFVEPSPGHVEIIYSSRTADDFPALNAVDLTGRTRRVTSRYFGEQLSVSAGHAVFDQLDLARSVALRSDLYQLDLGSGAVTRLTRDGRLGDPAIAPTGEALACIRSIGGERQLAVFDLPPAAWPRDAGILRAALAARPRLMLAEPGVEYSSPRWSPDGRRVAVTRHIREGPTEIVLVDRATGAQTILVSSDRARNITPTWTPDGRTILFASDREGGPFNLYAVDLQDGAAGALEPGSTFQVTDFITGASYPAVSADGRQIAYVGYTAAGYHVYVLPLDRATWHATRLTDGVVNALSAHASESTGARQPIPTITTGTSRTYRPWRTLLPRYWIPALDQSDQQLKLGARTSGSDVLGRHTYAATVLYRVAGSTGAPGSRRYDWAAGYTYDRWLPACFVDASDRTHFLRDIRLPDGAIVPADLRDQNGEVGVFVPDFHVRYQQSVTASVNLQRQSVNLGGVAGSQSDRNAIRLAWSFNSAKVYAYSISPEQGATIGVTGELVRRALGADASADATTVDGRAFVRLGGRHTILALRAAGGAANGDARTSRFFYLGGSGPNINPADFGSDALNLLRGFDQNESGGTRIAVVNVEYRVPLVRVQRGVGTWPFFLRTVHAAGFFDAGKAWTKTFSSQPFARSAGAELAADLRLGYQLPLTAVFGVAWPKDPHGVARSPTVYFRIGRAF